MAFFGRRRRQRVEWFNGNFDAAPVLNAAGVTRFITLVGGQQALDFGFAGELYIRRVIGTIALSATGLVAYNAVAQLTMSKVLAGVIANEDPLSGVAFEDADILWRRDWSTLNFAFSIPQWMDLRAFEMDWKGNRLLKEGSSSLVLAINCNVAHTTFVRTRVLLQAPRR